MRERATNYVRHGSFTPFFSSRDEFSSCWLIGPRELSILRVACGSPCEGPESRDPGLDSASDGAQGCFYRASGVATVAKGQLSRDTV